MPLLGKEEFTLKSLPPNLDPNAEVFYCSSTGEAFLSYDEYFERNMLCSSLFWTCSVTGKSGLTYADALKSEKESQTLLSSVPRVLQRILLHLMKYLNNFSTNIVLSILLEYTNLRYFIGENVQVLTTKSKRLNGFIRDVIPPDNLESSATIAYGMDPLSYQYVVELIDTKRNGKDKENKLEIVSASRISRPKCLLTREKLRLFLKQHLSPKSGRYQTLSIKEESVHKFGLDHLKWEDIFKGPTPNFTDDTTILKAFNKRVSDAPEQAASSQNNSSEKGTEETSMQVVKKKSNILSAQKLKLIKREEKKEKAAAPQVVSKKKVKKLKSKEKSKLKTNNNNKKGKKKKSQKEQITEEQTLANAKQDKIEEKKKEKEFRRKFEEDTRVWMEKRDDLLCDDLKPLPTPTVIDCGIENNLIGDSLMIIEFINAFQDHLSDFHDIFPSGITTDLFSQILKDVDVHGPYSDLLQILLDTILLSNAVDVDQEGDLKIKTNDEFDSLNNDEDNFANFCTTNASNQWVSTYFAKHEQLAQLKLDSFTLTEILRIYILKARVGNVKRSRSDDDKDISLAIRLTTDTVWDLNSTERICLLKLLLDDLVKVPLIRQKIEDSMEDIFKHRSQIRHLNASFTKWLRDNPIRQRMRKKKSSDNAENKEESTTDQPENEATPAEKEQYKREKNQREQQMKKSISELKAKIRKLSSFCRPHPLGSDRSFRRYWVFQSVSGLLVEHSLEDNQPCLDAPTPMQKPQLSDYLPNAKKRKRNNSMKKEEADAIKETLDSPNMPLFERCSGNHLTCSVHGKVNSDSRIRWSFYTKEQLDDFIESLNARGYRENELKNSLIFEKNSLLKYHLDRFVPTTLNPSYLPPLKKEEEESENDEPMDLNLRKSERIQNQVHEKIIQTPKPAEPVPKHLQKYSRYSNLPPMEAHEKAFKDELLLLEDNIFNSCLTSFRLDDRDNWYKSVPAEIGDKVNSIKNFTRLFKTLVKSLRPFCLLHPISDTSASSPSDKENIEHVQPKIPVLSEKWTDVFKAAENLTSGQLNDSEASFGISNLSQMFVNLYILEKSINWELSAMKTATKCRICRRKANDEMILCDKCNRGYHIYCLKPPIVSIDEIEGDWFCYTCDPRPKATSLKRSISEPVEEAEEEGEEESEEPFKEEDDEEQSYNEVADEEYTSDGSFDDDGATNCRVCKHRLYDEYSEVLCKSCNKGYHLKCVNLTRVPRSWSCLSCESQERYNSMHSDDNGDLRRSSRKRKPNHYYDDSNSLDDQLYPTKAKRYLSSEDNMNRRTQRV